MNDVIENVSRETSEKLLAFAALVEKWTAKINLVSKASVPEIWQRHIVDSAQVLNAAPQNGSWVDLGSGGGFPGIVVAIISQGAQSPYDFTFVESDQRKCVFLRTALRELEIKGTVLNERIESLVGLQADIISARALADLSTLLGFADLHLKAGGTALFQKGGHWKSEVSNARRIWSCSVEPITSKTDPAAVILKIKDIVRA
jgi:16S rRNA (guanine527-N7)-methyltransferase